MSALVCAGLPGSGGHHLSIASDVPSLGVLMASNESIDSDRGSGHAEGSAI